MVMIFIFWMVRVKPKQRRLAPAAPATKPSAAHPCAHHVIMHARPFPNSATYRTKIFKTCRRGRKRLYRLALEIQQPRLVTNIV